MLVRAMTSWESGLCAGRQPVSMQYNSEVSEPSARGLFLGGATDIGLTTEPATGSGVHPYTYAPVAVTASAVAYWVDNAATGLPYTNLKMNPRLLAKLMTLSYNFLNSGCKAGTPPPPKIGCDGAVDGNPINLWADPEFQQLNPGLNPPNPFGGFQVPTVVSGPNDMTWDVTRWIGANPDATGFMAGQFDQWGMHVNTNYLGQKYPTQTFIGLDPYPVIAHRFTPVYPELRVAMYQADNWDSGTDWQQDVTGNYPADPVQTPGNRALFAIVDEADAAAFQFPSLALLNHAGKYVTPSQASMAAAVRDMTVNPDGITRSYNENSTDPAGYPLTMVVYAMVPTSGISKAKAVKIAQFLDYVAGAGQAQGTSPGQLPAGYLPLPASLRAQTLKAAYEVLHQTGARPPGHSHGGGGGSPQNPGSTPSGSTSPAGTSGNGSSSSSSSAPPSTTGSSHGSKAPAAFSSPDTAGFARLMLPILLIIGALLALAGPSAVVLGRPGGRAAIVAGWRRVKSLDYLPAPLRGRKK
jgi:hypothetical protein